MVWLRESEMWRLAAMMLVVGLYFVIFVIDDNVPLTVEQKKTNRRQNVVAAKLVWIMWASFAVLQLVQHHEPVECATVSFGVAIFTILLIRFAGPNCFTDLDEIKNTRAGVAGEKWPWK